MPRTKTCDVFVSHAPSDIHVADEIAERCRLNNLQATTDAEVAAKKDPENALWEALAECAGLVVVLPPSGLITAMTFVIGAAQAWNKPIFAVATDLASAKAPPGLSTIPVIAFGQIDDVIQALRRRRKDLTDNDRNLLARLYGDLGVPVDRLAMASDSLDGLAKRFSTDTGKTIPEERLLTELVRMRKQGRLAKTRNGVKPKMRKTRGTS